MTSRVRSLVERCYASEPAYAEVRAGVPEDFGRMGTVGDLLEANYTLLPSREQIRRNLIATRRRGGRCYPGIIGFDDDVVPALDRALLSRHDVLLVGQMGQAKTRLVQTVAETLLSEIPVIAGSVTNDCPMDLPPERLASILDGEDPQAADPVFHMSPESMDVLRDRGLEAPIVWLPGRERYRCVLATPDLSVKDLVGYIDAVKVARKGVEMYRIDSYSPGQLMQAKHGIFCMDELSVLDPRKQVALLSVLQEGRFTTGSYPVMFEPRTVLFATVNPSDYTHSGMVIEPLSDRLRSHVHTHYPGSVEDEMMIIIQEASAPKCIVPLFVLRVLAVLIGRMRQSGQINQERGVSARLGIHGLEVMIGEAERTRALEHGIIPVPRLSDLHSLEQTAKFELSETDDTVQNRRKILCGMIDESVREVSAELLGDVDGTTLASIREEFEDGAFYISQSMPWGGTASYKAQLEQFPALAGLLELKLAGLAESSSAFGRTASAYGVDCTVLSGYDDELRASLTEALLEGLRWTRPRILDRHDAAYVRA